MNLPNFINFEPFNALRRKMHIENLGNFSGRTSAIPANVAVDINIEVVIQPTSTVKLAAKKAKVTKKAVATKKVGVKVAKSSVAPRKKMIAVKAAKPPIEKD